MIPRLDQVEFNAKSLSPSQVAATFVPPLAAFERLVNKNNCVVIGPRGSGKTTLFKMLLRRALPNWRDLAANQFLSRVRFHTVFIPADRAWGGQLSADGADRTQRDGAGTTLGEAAFCAHTLIALVVAMRDSKEIANLPEDLSALHVELTNDDEADLAIIVARSLQLELGFPSLLGLEISLRDALLRMDPRKPLHEYPIWANVGTLPTTISLMISIFSGIAKTETDHWVFLFDELEIAPQRIKSFLLDHLRGFEQKVTLKLAIVPFLRDIKQLSENYQSAQGGNDFDVIPLYYPNKDDAIEFSSALCGSLLERAGLGQERPEELFGTSVFNQGRMRLSSAARNATRAELPETFRSLAGKDPSFARYIELKGLNKPGILTEERRAADIRKVIQTVMLRDFHIKSPASHSRVTPGQLVWRSRKSLSLYTGYPSILEISEGNPRTLLSLLVPLVSDLVYRRESNAKLTIDHVRQGDAINRAVQTLVALVKTLPPSWAKRPTPRGLLDFVDTIGRALESRLLRDNFDPDYVGTFTVDDDSDGSVVAAVGEALNAGALVFVPDEGSTPDATLTSLVNKRFRLSYTLAPRYRLPLILGRPVKLSSLLRARNRLSSDQGKLSLR